MRLPLHYFYQLNWHRFLFWAFDILYSQSSPRINLYPVTPNGISSAWKKTIWKNFTAARKQSKQHFGLKWMFESRKWSCVAKAYVHERVYAQVKIIEAGVCTWAGATRASSERANSLCARNWKRGRGIILSDYAPSTRPAYTFGGCAIASLMDS